MDKDDYEGKMDELLKGEDYVRIKRNPTAEIEKKVKDTLIRLERNNR